MEIAPRAKMEERRKKGGGGGSKKEEMNGLAPTPRSIYTRKLPPEVSGLRAGVSGQSGVFGP